MGRCRCGGWWWVGVGGYTTVLHCRLSTYHSRPFPQLAPSSSSTVLHSLFYPLHHHTLDCKEPTRLLCRDRLARLFREATTLTRSVGVLYDCECKYCRGGWLCSSLLATRTIIRQLLMCYSSSYTSTSTSTSPATTLS